MRRIATECRALARPISLRIELRAQSTAAITFREQACGSYRGHFQAPAVNTVASASSFSNQSTTRLFWSSSDFSDKVETDTEESAATSHLPAPTTTPSNISAASLIAPSTVESLKSLPECQSVLDIITGSDIDNVESAHVKEAHANLQRARDILQSMPDLQGATYLIEADLLSLCGKFDSALEVLAKYERTAKIDESKRKLLQFLTAKLLVHSGAFSHALSEYEDLLEEMEREVERQVQMQQEQTNKEGEWLPVINGAAALTGIGVAKLLVHLREGGNGQGTANLTKSEIMEPIETATAMLLESREDALRSLDPDHAALAVDLGLAASISLTNLGVAHLLLNDDVDQSIDCWKRALNTLDSILEGAIRLATIIPRFKFQCMESVRARLYCNISWALLGLNELHSGLEGEACELSDKTLKDSSEAAKKALDIYDELMNGPKMPGDKSDSGGEKADKDSDREELEQILRERVESERDDKDPEHSNFEPKELPLSPLWTAYIRSESARALGLVAKCYASAGAAVTAEGLFQSALDASSSYPFGGKSAGIVSSPNLGLVARDVRMWYAMLCDNWDKRKGDADRLRLNAGEIDETGVLKEYVRSEDGTRQIVSGLESSLWFFSPLDFGRR
ncbi:hypothetical protein ACHAWF_006282 [Thalassiosira exigua]